jgi:hypothetical protein
MKNMAPIVFALAVAIAWPPALQAWIKLAALPQRERVEIQLDRARVGLQLSAVVRPMQQCLTLDRPA